MNISRLGHLNYHNDGEDWIVVDVSNEEDAKYLNRVIRYSEDRRSEGSSQLFFDGQEIKLSNATAVARLG